MKHILAVGNATLDLVFALEDYPREDSEVRAQDMQMRRGGNAANTLAVLSQLGHRCALAGVLADGAESDLILADLARHHIDTSACQKLAGRPPTSCVLLNRRDGKRTIVHYRDIPEYSFGSFQQIRLAPWDWIHFEARNNVGELACMLRHVRDQRPDLRCSLEVEKARPWVRQLFPMVDVLLCSRAYAHAKGFAQPYPFLHWLREQAPHADLIVAWGEEGAYGLDRYDQQHHSPAFAPPEVKDTLGAGDTFNAAVIDAYLRDLALDEILQAGCHLAGVKCGQEGLDDLVAPKLHRVK